jgi:hypothetical protein
VFTPETAGKEPIMSASNRVERITLALGALVLAVAPVAAQDIPPEQWVRRAWTHGTTHAANEVVGARAGMSFSFLPPGPVREIAEVTVLGGPVAELVQIMDLGLVPPPTNDLPPGPIAVRVRLLPPGPIAPARLEVQLLDMTNVTLLDANGAPVALCIPGPQ